MAFLDQIGKQLQQALGRNAYPVTLNIITPGSVNPSNLNGSDSPTAVSYSGKAVTDTYALGQIDGVNVQRTDVKIIVFVKSLPSGCPIPTVKDQVVANGTTFNIINVDPVPRDAPAVYTLQARK